MGKVYFVDAAHLLHNAVPGRGWIKRTKTVELKTNSGTPRLNVLGAYSPDDHTLISIEGTESCDAEMVRRLLRKLRAANPNQELLLVLDNVRVVVQIILLTTDQYVHCNVRSPSEC